ncbi:hypothetical protein L9F63_021090, partial [Diploptera punctata]
LSTLRPTDPPTFEVEKLTLNETTTQLAAVGSRGVAILDLPRRWGKEATFQGGKETISC